MNLEQAVRITEILIALALMQQTVEHLSGWHQQTRVERSVFIVRMLSCGGLIANLAQPWPLMVLAGLSLALLMRFQGPYNGGADRMALLAIWCLLATRLATTTMLQELFFGYLGLQLLLSYFVSGWVKLVNPEWRNGRALGDVFLFSAYPVSEGLRQLAQHPAWMVAASWAVMLLELLFPLALMHRDLLLGALLLTAMFHAANACLFGLNRFLWTWLSVYPSLIWLQARIIG